VNWRGIAPPAAKAGELKVNGPAALAEGPTGDGEAGIGLTSDGDGTATEGGAEAVMDGLAAGLAGPPDEQAAIAAEKTSAAKARTAGRIRIKRGCASIPGPATVASLGRARLAAAGRPVAGRAVPAPRRE
jgi:hypothetical protein